MYARLSSMAHSLCTLLFTTITIRRWSTFNRIRSLLQQGLLARRVHNIRTVDSVFAEIWPILLELPKFNLTVIKSPLLPLRSLSQSKNCRCWRQLVEMVNSSPNLRILEIGYLDDTTVDPDPFFRAIQPHTTLEELTIEDMSTYYTRRGILLPLIVASARLNKVHIRCSRYTYLGSDSYLIDENQQFQKLAASLPPTFHIKDLAIARGMYDTSGCNLLSILKLFPNVERFGCPRLRPSLVSGLIAIMCSTMVHLRHLDMRDTSMTGLLVAQVIAACTDLRTYLGSRHQTNPQPVASSLLKHGPSLTALDLGDSTIIWTEHGILQELLCTCPNLEQFSAIGSLTTARQWKASSPRPLPIVQHAERTELDSWICRILRSLRIRFESRVDSDTRESSLVELVPHSLVAQLAKMGKLEDVRQGCVSSLKVESTRLTSSIIGSNNIEVDRVQCPTFEAISEKQVHEGRASVPDLLRALTESEGLRRLEQRGLKAFVAKDELK